jgi:hypothetical protein
MAGLSKSRSIIDPVRDITRENRGYLQICLEIGNFRKMAEILAVWAKNPGTCQRGSSKGWCNDDTLLIFAIKGPEKGRIFSMG